MFRAEVHVVAAFCLFSSVPDTARAASLPDDFQDQLVAGGLTQPSSLDFLPDGRILVLEQNLGTVRLVVGGVLAAGAVHTVADLNNSGNEQGLLGVAVDPRWPVKPFVYLFFDRTPGSVMFISRLRATGDLTNPSSSNLTLSDRYDVIVDIPDNASNHNGGTLRFGPDSMLYATLGDDASACAAQDSTDLRGVVLRMNTAVLPDSGTGPADKALIRPAGNPFPGANANAGLTFAFGLRNPFRFQIDSVTGNLYIGDVGANAYEEMSEGAGGENFGWPFREGPAIRVQFGCSEPGGQGSQSYASPIGFYAHVPGSQAVIAGPRYRPVAGGSFTFPLEYNGVVFFSEYYDGFVRALKKSGGSWAPLPAVPGQPDPQNWATGIDFVGDFLEGPDGAIYYVKQFPGEVRRIVFTGTVTGIPATRVPLLSVRPNPFRPGGAPLEIRLDHPGKDQARLEVYALTGRRVKTLSDRSGTGDAPVLRWDGRDHAGRPLAPGVYFLRLGGPAGPASTRVVLLP